MQNSMESGKRVTLPAPADTLAGGFVQVGDLQGVAINAALSGADVVLETEGVFELPKATGAAWVVGDRLYWDPIALKFTKTSTSNVRAGAAFVAAASGDATGFVRLNPFAG